MSCDWFNLRLLMFSAHEIFCLRFPPGSLSANQTSFQVSPESAASSHGSTLQLLSRFTTTCLLIIQKQLRRIVRASSPKTSRVWSLESIVWESDVLFSLQSVREHPLTSMTTISWLLPNYLSQLGFHQLVDASCSCVIVQIVLDNMISDKRRTICRWAAASCWASSQHLRRVCCVMWPLTPLHNCFVNNSDPPGVVCC